jgi:hypothetical protein
LFVSIVKHLRTAGAAAKEESRNFSKLGFPYPEFKPISQELETIFFGSRDRMFYKNEIERWLTKFSY